MAKRVIITGATGFIGRALSKRLVASGYQVVGLSRDLERGRRILGEKITILEWDGQSAEGWGRQADGAYGVINLAGESIASGRWTEKKKQRIVRSRLDAGRAVSDAIAGAKSKPGVVIQSSGIGYYGSRGDEMVDESSPAGEGFLPDLAKEWEGSTKGVEALGVRQVTIRTGIVLGKDGGALPRLLTPFRFFIGGQLGSGRQAFPWIHVADQVEAICFLLENEKLRGAFNLAAPEQISMKQFCRTLGRVVGRPCWLHVPGFVLRLLYGQMADEALLSGQKRRAAEAAGGRVQIPLSRRGRCSSPHSGLERPNRFEYLTQNPPCLSDLQRLSLQSCSGSAYSNTPVLRALLEGEHSSLRSRKTRFPLPFMQQIVPSASEGTEREWH